ncbi:aa3-type cytochrome c oxidase subunit IV [Sphingomonas gilva]|uniref:Aa3-type cytochrome c oxidase subunit IV n=1 Tax=Sphingomonas gilva TaxID=2305907 RepID=A0A396RVL5_9SPHN|nr:aa3-type cytochrome c oxidase subunit IV [Sphingomonas gilva]RHW17721.1 aa3-type cytochrome c oxidase subunit IV [Sphingomonas gilva]
MAEHGEMDMKAHVKTYGGVMSLLKWGTIVSFVAALAVIFMIS